MERKLFRRPGLRPDAERGPADPRLRGTQIPLYRGTGIYFRKFGNADPLSRVPTGRADLTRAQPRSRQERRDPLAPSGSRGLSPAASLNIARPHTWRSRLRVNSRPA